MNALDFEQQHGLKVLKKEDTGITREALYWAARWCRTFTPDAVFLLYQEEPWDFVTYLVDSLGYALKFKGFAWGYGGEGPRGLASLFEIIGWRVPSPVEVEQIPAHTPGVWSIRPDGTVLKIR